jgi:hypothetical protein
MTVKLQKSFQVSVPPRSSGAEIHTAMNAIQEPYEEVHVLAGSAQFLTPREICGLRALVDYAATKATRVIFDCPVDADTHRYLARVDFYEDLPVNVYLTQPIPAMTRIDRPDRLIELIRIRTVDDVENLMDRVWAVSKTFGRPLAVACTTAIGAATENTVTHAASPIGALVSAQIYRSAGLELSVVDIGRGIPATLASNPRHRGLNDLEAVERSLLDGVTSANDAGRGAGLAELVQAVGRAGNSTLQIASGRAELTLGWARGHQRRNRRIPAYTVRGTWIFLRLAA